MNKLGGSILGQLEKNLDLPSNSVIAYAQIGRLLREFHRIPMEAFGYIGPKGHMDSTLHQSRLPDTSSSSGNSRNSSQGGGDAVSRATGGGTCRGARATPPKAAHKPVLCHNDLHAGNLLADDRATGPCGSRGVLDFEGALAGDPLMDVAKALYYLDDKAHVRAA